MCIISYRKSVSIRAIGIVIEKTDHASNTLIGAVLIESCKINFLPIRTNIPGLIPFDFNDITYAFVLSYRKGVNTINFFMTVHLF